MQPSQLGYGQSPQYVQPSPPQYAQHPDAVHAQPQLGVPQQSAKPRRPWVLWVILAAVLVIVGGFFAVRAVLGATPVSAPVESETFQAEELPEYIESAAYVDDLIEKYHSMSVDDQAALFPGGAAGYDSSYVNDFLFSLVETQVELDQLADFPLIEGGDSEAEASTWILNLRAEAEALEQSFFAQESFGDKFLTLEDGTVYRSDGKYFPEGTPAYNAEREAFAQGFQGAPDAGGSYVAAAEELANGLGMTLNFNFREQFAHCKAPGGADPATADFSAVAAAYCPKSQNVIYLNTEIANYDLAFNTPLLINTVKHEFAHARVAGVCGGTADPPIVKLSGANHEGTADSFSVMFLGANPELMVGKSAEYTMSEATNTAAQLIHDGQCE